MDERALRPRTGAQIAEPALQAEQLAQALDVAARKRQAAETRRRRPAALVAPTGAARQDAERRDERAEQDRVGQRVWRRLEAAAICVERSQRSPERLR